MSSSITPTNSSVSATAANGKAQSFYVAEPAWAETFRLTIQVVLAFTGLVGNVLVCLVITLQPKMKTVVNCLIRNLAIADICILVFSFPVGVIREQAKYRWPLGEFACRGVHPMVDMFYGVSVWSIVIVAIDRYKAIVWVARPNKKRALKAARWTVAFIWLISFLVISLPLYLVTELQDKSPLYVLCQTAWPNQVTSQVYLVGVLLFWYAIPLAIVIWTFQGISRKLHASTKFNKRISRDLGSDQSDESTNKRIREKQNSKAKKILIPVVLVFAVTMFPINALRLTVVFWEDIIYNRLFWVYYHISLTLIVVNSSANCFIYSIVSKDFRQGFRRLFSGTRERLTSIASPLIGRQRRKQQTRSTML